MNPLSTATDSSFTSTGKGLLTIFSVGLVKVVIGVEFINTQISIPWFPTINLANLHNLTYLYMAFMFYAILRYRLHNESSFRTIGIIALSDGLKSGWIGRWFVYRYILNDNENYMVRTNLTSSAGKSNDLVPPTSITIVSFDDEFMASEFNLIARDSIQIDSAVVKIDIVHGIEQKALSDEKLKRMWGHFWDCTREQGEKARDYTFYQTITPPSRTLSLLLSFISTFYQVKHMKKDPMCLDVYLPWLLNLGLLSYLCAAYLLPN
ncbi:hypothetical protein TW81_10840 [Vibrio galatheae]|uniref:Uncharacterized protein n=1 Tax=Vibrio galatheae TaxID=579748 RepID=A0A0F4NIF4_9VIBR|nr:hypothetical protein [Vibrio galatheae]KJY82714.1 hypothetical protein TW81_10840 [Vibrio galatheae]